MKYLVLSDTHGRMANLMSTISSIEDRLDGIIHLGDCTSDAKKIHEWFPRLPMLNVSGNCDFDKPVEDYKIVDIYDHKVLLTHGHMQNVKSSLDRLYYFAKEQNVGYCLFGHTHVPLIERMDDVCVFNPGSTSEPRGTRTGTYGILDATKKSLEFTIVNM